MNSDVLEVVVIEPIGVRAVTAAKMIDCSVAKLYQLISKGELETFKVGADDRVTVASIRKYAESKKGTK